MSWENHRLIGNCFYWGKVKEAKTNLRDRNYLPVNSILKVRLQVVTFLITL